MCSRISFARCVHCSREAMTGNSRGVLRFLTAESPAGDGDAPGAETKAPASKKATIPGIRTGGCFLKRTIVFELNRNTRRMAMEERARESFSDVSVRMKPKTMWIGETAAKGIS